MDIAERRPSQCWHVLVDEDTLGIFRPGPHVLQILGHLFEGRRQQGEVARDPHHVLVALGCLAELVLQSGDTGQEGGWAVISKEMPNEVHHHT